MLLSETPNPTKTNYTQTNQRRKQQINALLFVQTKSRQLSLSLFYYRFFVIPNGWKIGYMIIIIIIIEKIRMSYKISCCSTLTVYGSIIRLFSSLCTHKINIDTLHAGCTPQVNSAEHTVRDVMKIIIIYCYPLGLSYKLLCCSNNHYFFKLMSGIVLY